MSSCIPMRVLRFRSRIAKTLSMRYPELTFPLSYHLQATAGGRFYGIPQTSWSQ